MDIDAVNLMNFYQKYADLAILNNTPVRQAQAHAHEFVTKAFQNLTAVFGDSLKSCLLPNSYIGHQKCIAESAGYDVSGFVIKLYQNEGFPHNFVINIKRNEALFELKSNPYNIPNIFAFSSKPFLGNSLDTRIEFHENKPTSWMDSSSISSKDANGFALGNTFLSASCSEDSLPACHEYLLDNFKSSLEDFKRDAMASNEPAESAESLKAVLAGIGVVGVGLGLYAKYRSGQKKKDKIKEFSKKGSDLKQKIRMQSPIPVPLE